MEPYIPLGDWRWGLVILICLAPGLFVHRQDIWQYITRSFSYEWWRHYKAWRSARIHSATTPMCGSPELERCHQEFVTYVGTPFGCPIGHREIAATQAFLPHVKRLGQILDEQGIPHPPISTKGLTFDGTGEWGDFLASLMAIQHDVEQARRVYQGKSRT